MGRRRILLSLGGGLLLLGVLALALGWYALGEERRTARLLSRFLSRQVGIPIRIERATAEPSRLTLRGVRIPPGQHWSGSLEIRELRVEGGVLPVVFPSGRSVSVVAVSTSVTLAKEPAPLTALAPETLTAIRATLLRFLEWPAVVSLEMKGGEIRSGNETLAFDLGGEKAGDGKLALRLDFQRAGEPTALAVSVQVASEVLADAPSPDVRLVFHIEGDPRRLGPFWPSGLPALSRLRAEGDLLLSGVPELDVTGMFTAALATGSAPLGGGVAARYRPRQQRVDLAQLALNRGPALRLDLRGSAEELDTTPRLTVKVDGTVDGSRVTGDATYTGGSAGLRAKLDLRPFAAGPLLDRFGFSRPAFEVRAENAALTLEGRVQGKDRLQLQGVLGLEGVEAPWATKARLRAKIRVSGALTRGDKGISVAALDSGELALASSAGEIGLVALRPRVASGRLGELGPLAVEAGIPDLSRLPVFEAFPLKLSGDARLEGTLEWRDSGSRFAGTLTARVPGGEITVGGPIALSGLKAALPLAWGPGEEAPAGTVTAESLTAFGFVLRRLASPALVRGSVLSLPEISYVHYGGSGQGNARGDLGGVAVPLQMRLEGEGVNLATLTTEYGLTVGRITGKVRYLLVLQHSQARGLVLAGHAAADPPGGEVAIDALKKLLAYAEADPSGILKRALENLSVFSYASLEADIRVGPQGGRVSLSLEGKKRFGLFPGPVRAINFQNVPLSLLVRTFGQPRRESP
ncbi:MAG: hypothetical protein HYU24_01185 [Candidatus Rokubacteria bacterium]|nr:hypothetical protein [Candidatus Rokubacteria bacterium]